MNRKAFLWFWDSEIQLNFEAHTKKKLIRFHVIFIHLDRHPNLFLGFDRTPLNHLPMVKRES